MNDQKKKVYIVGHRNPDTDSICSAICYAELKNKITGEAHEAKRAGNVNEETQYVLDYFGVKAPEFLENAENEKVILVDHNEMTQTVDGVKNAEIMEVIGKEESIKRIEKGIALLEAALS